MAKSLFKYTKAEYIDSILEGGGLLKLSNPSEFNDPNDCNFGVTEDNLNKSFRMLLNVAFICEFRNDPVYSRIKSFKTAYELTRKSVYVSHVYIENPAVNMLIKQYLSTRKELANFFDEYKKNFDVTYANIVDNIKSKSLIASLTKDNLNTLMWSHYANKHEGICVEYEFSDDSELSDVVYSDNINNFDLYTALKYIIPIQYFGVPDTTSKSDPHFKNACFLPFLIKTKEWSYENETRMIFSLNETSQLVNNNGLWFYPKARVKSVYIGCKMSKEMQKIVEDKCSILNIPVYHLALKKGNNRLTIED